MALKSVASLVLHVKDPQRSRTFYEELGFLPSKGAPGEAEVRLNWFKIRLVPAATPNPGTDLHVVVAVDDLADIERRFPEGKRDGNRILAHDPDGYPLVFNLQGS